MQASNTQGNGNRRLELNQRQIINQNVSKSHFQNQNFQNVKVVSNIIPQMNQGNKDISNRMGLNIINQRPAEKKFVKNNEIF